MVRVYTAGLFEKAKTNTERGLAENRLGNPTFIGKAGRRDFLPSAPQKPQVTVSEIADALQNLEIGRENIQFTPELPLISQGTAKKQVIVHLLPCKAYKGMPKGNVAITRCKRKAAKDIKYQEAKPKWHKSKPPAVYLFETGSGKKPSFGLPQPQYGGQLVNSCLKHAKQNFLYSPSLCNMEASIKLENRAFLTASMWEGVSSNKADLRILVSGLGSNRL
ncbi:hypothetical protein CC78DRAFT_574783 [Lojkania enalia]|uniref:Uncharacterized protein n=1 Tax=Lojkania enalia TaxID=147567 RepID=A0A9P4TQZ1_9PLEO|nr:hypothetical protein CC78DRAFT_574783 [Didymosphaeria enalia]